MTLTEIKAPAEAKSDGQSPAPHYGYVADRPDWLARGSVLALLVAVGFLYLWGLSASGYANSFYSAAAQAGADNWVAWFFGSLDGGNSITVDKPPAAIWLMALSVRLFGLSSWSILVPEALLGVASVGVLYATVRRSVLSWRGQGTHPLTARNAHWAALAGAVVFALTPVATLMFRFNNPDALLVFTMMAASYFTVRAAEHAGRGWLALAGVAIGLGFLTKMIQAFLVLPALVVAYWFAAPASWKKKILDLLVAFVAMIASFGWYLAAVELTPASLRPYIGGSQNNSIIELILSYNGLGRLTGNETGSVGGGNGGNWGTTSILRMFEGVSGGMVSWLIPAALILATGAITVAVLNWRRQPGEERTQSPSQALIAGAIIWLGWLSVTALVFSFMAGIYHDYYTVALAPAIGGAVAIGGAALWANRGHWAARVTLGVTSLGTGVWALVLLLQAGSWYTYLGWTAFALGTVSGLAMIWADQLPKRIAAAVLAVALGAGLIGPLAYSINTAATAHTGSIVTAGPVSGTGAGMGGGPGGQGDGGQGGPGGGQPPAQTGQTGTQTGQDGGMGGLLNGANVSEEMLALLTANASDYTWVAATTGSQNAASYQLASNAAVMAIGGFNGSDPSPTLEEFKAYVAAGKIHYYVAGSIGQSSGGSDSASQIAEWVASNFTAQTVDSTTIYDLTAQK
ncbi:glycosyltransferase family 39 protein [Propionicimonas sp.]|uniref:ArnT family glycosyltransferase n=1 Tax=Propionicimonas sp. TaxID=1955623 RepID=UPI00182CC04F|nr:glycosyltransferase family 39 protein [Propionicimonas sp.]MBU3978056.1 glycosyltransferase family 39 protein [Actinomycetota bacterium]MBA3021958.1 glycosyltransferase family 39 protein [Propionicimonas sp.]MBU3985502.1 glycosyltransferase family 39 protein [Actinomycetota bacterium]MBU4007665.1 glycosyltransferase family 39 protein [Actinomycetota bacterium]MBU4064440.1 glycosyltransferase family 39 protein [Actinomycetota bacterium]